MLLLLLLLITITTTIIITTIDTGEDHKRSLINVTGFDSLQDLSVYRIYSLAKLP